MKSVLLGATILMGLSAPGWADINSIRIDATSNGGTVKTLSITQDDAHLANQVSGNLRRRNYGTADGRPLGYGQHQSTGWQ